MTYASPGEAMPVREPSQRTGVTSSRVSTLWHSESPSTGDLGLRISGQTVGGRNPESLIQDGFRRANSSLSRRGYPLPGDKAALEHPAGRASPESLRPRPARHHAQKPG